MKYDPRERNTIIAIVCLASEIPPTFGTHQD